MQSSPPSRFRSNVESGGRKQSANGLFVEARSALHLLLSRPLSCLALIAVVAIAACRESPAPRPPTGVDVQHYDLALRLDPATRALQAHVVLDVRHPDSLTALPLAFEALTIATFFYEHTDGLDAARRQWVAMAALSSSRQRTHTALVVQKPLPPEEYLTWVSYEKGASVLHLLRRTLGDEAFFTALRTGALPGVRSLRGRSGGCSRPRQAATWRPFSPTGSTATICLA